MSQREAHRTQRGSADLKAAQAAEAAAEPVPVATDAEPAKTETPVEGAEAPVETEAEAAKRRPTRRKAAVKAE
jgi:hypothetical protein